MIDKVKKMEGRVTKIEEDFKFDLLGLAVDFCGPQVFDPKFASFRRGRGDPI